MAKKLLGKFKMDNFPEKIPSSKEPKFTNYNYMKYLKASKLLSKN